MLLKTSKGGSFLRQGEWQYFFLSHEYQINWPKGYYCSFIVSSRTLSHSALAEITKSHRFNRLNNNKNSLLLTILGNGKPKVKLLVSFWLGLCCQLI